MKTKTFYLICTTQRSGSNFLCSGLTSTGLAGYPSEYFLTSERKRFGTEWSAQDIDSYIERLIYEKATPNGVFGAKVMWDAFGSLLNELQKSIKYRNISATEIMEHTFPNLRYIHLVRKDKVRQAVSYLKACQTGVWHKTADDKSLNSRTKKPKFDHSQVTDIINTFGARDTNWRRYFTKNKITPLTIVYENLENNYKSTILDVMKYLGIKIPDKAISVKSNCIKLTDAISEEWVKNYT